MLFSCFVCIKTRLFIFAVESSSSRRLFSLSRTASNSPRRHLDSTFLHVSEKVSVMGKAKKTRKFAEVKRVLNVKSTKCVLQ